MPIAFPQPSLDPSYASVKLLSAKLFFVVPAPSMAAPNKLYTAFTFDAGKAEKAINLREGGAGPKKMYRDPRSISIVNPAQGIDQAVDHGQDNSPTAARVMGTLRSRLSGVSRDNAGVALPNCQVLIFRTEDKTLVSETISDGSGNWTIEMLKGGPFFFVEYLIGSPDVFGTSKNDRVPLIIP